MPTPIKVLFIASEADPLIKVGGLGDVAGSLPYAMESLDPKWLNGDKLDIRLAIPFHAAIKPKVENLEKVAQFNIEHISGPITAEVFATDINRVRIYLIASDLFTSGEPVYTGDNYRDGLKYTFFSLAALELPRHIDWYPDILHANDWHTAIVPYAAKYNPDFDYLHNVPSILSIHNLPYLGNGAENSIAEFGIYPSGNPDLPDWSRAMPLPMGLATADRIIAVSPTYGSEILTPEFGCGLENYLLGRRDSVMGILNGLDQSNWDPARDPALVANFDFARLPKRQKNREAILKEHGLNTDPTIPLMIIISRMDYQKGIDLAIEALYQLASEKWQAIILGTGDRIIESNCVHLQESFPDRVRTVLRFDAQLSRRMYASGDMILMPSRYEPCGLAQMIAMRYGCVPIARATGGLKDTIQDSSAPGATGFLFTEARSRDLAEAIERALRYYAEPDRWRELQLRGMQMDFSWQRSAIAYGQIYRSLIGG